MGVIYKITCLKTNLTYIGKTIKSVKVRLRQHRDKKSYCRLLSKEINEHGWENFKHEILWEGDNSQLGDMERHLIMEHNTLEPSGLNIREGGGRSEKVSDSSRQIMIDKQREISMRRGGYLGYIIQNKCSFSFRFMVNNVHRIMNFKTLEEAQKAQKEYTDDPDNFTLPEPSRVGNGKANGLYFDKSRNKWVAHNVPENVHLGRYETKEEAERVLEEYKMDPENFTKTEVKSKPKFYVYEHKRTNSKQKYRENYSLYIVKTYDNISKQAKNLASFGDKKSAEYYCETLQYNDRYDIV